MTSPNTPQRHPMPSPDTIVTHTLPNGLRIYVYENPTVPAVVVDGALPFGSVYEPPELNGLAALTAAMLRRGTRTHSFDTLNETLDALGASIELTGGRHALDIYIQCLSEDLSYMLELTAQMLREPRFPPDEFERLKQQTLTRIQERYNDTRAMAFLAFRRLLYGDHPYGRPVTGEKDTVSRVTLEHVRAFYRQHLTPQGGQLVIVGDVRAEAVIQRVTEVLGDWHGPNLDTSLPPVERPKAMRAAHIPMEDKSQTDIVLGWLSLPRNHPDWTPLVVANTLWGQFGMGGRIGDRVREKEGMAYYAYSTLEGNFAPGMWAAAAGVAPENVTQTISILLEEARRLREEPVTADELEEVQSFLVGSLPVRLETNEGLASVIGDMAWYNLGLDYLLTYEARVRNVTAADIQRVAHMYMDPDNYVLATAGPQAEVTPVQEAQVP